MSRNGAASEIQSVLEQLHTLAARGERLAVASGGLVSPSHFRAMQTMVSGAAGDLDQKGLLQSTPVAKELVG